MNFLIRFSIRNRNGYCNRQILLGDKSFYFISISFTNLTIFHFVHIKFAWVVVIVGIWIVLIHFVAVVLVVVPLKLSTYSMAYTCQWNSNSRMEIAGKSIYNFSYTIFDMYVKLTVWLFNQIKDKVGLFILCHISTHLQFVQFNFFFHLFYLSIIL